MSSSQPDPERIKTRAPRRPKRRRRKFAIGLFLLAATVLLLLPNVVAILFPGAILRFASRQIDGDLTADSLTLGWFQPIVLNEPRATDSDGTPVFQAQQITIHRSLLALALERRRIGIVELNQPKLNVVTWADGSNVEELLEPLLTAPSSNEPLECAWQIHDGEIQIASLIDGSESTWTIASLTGELKRTDHFHVSLDGTMSATVGNETGALTLKTTAQADTSDGGEAYDVYCEAESLPLRSLNPLLTRVATNTSLDGRFSGNAHVLWEPTAHRGHIDSLECRFERPVLEAPWLPDREPIRLDHISIASDAQWNEAHLDVNRLSIESAIASLHANAEVPLAPNTNLVEAGKRMLAEARVQADADIRLAALASTAPSLLRLRQDAELTAGTIELSLASEPQAGQAAWKAVVATSELRGARAGQPFTWEEPLKAELVARWTGNRLVLDQLICRSDFLNAQLEGNPQQGAVTAQADLDRLTERLSQFVNLRGTALSGSLDSRVEWLRDAGTWSLLGDVALDSLTWSLPNRVPWNEPQMNVHLAASGTTGADGQVNSVAAANLEITAPAERFTLNLNEPLRSAPFDSAWHLNLAISSKLEKWLPRLATILNLQLRELAGVLQVDSKLTLSPQSIDIRSLNIDIEQLLVSKDGVEISEPRAILKTSGSWSRETRSWTTEKLSLQTSAVAVGSDQLVLKATDAGATADGALSFTSDLERLSKWLVNTGPAAHQLRGELNGYTNFRSDGDQTQLDTNLNIGNFELLAQRPASTATNQPINTTSAWKPLWQEPQITVQGRSQWQAATGTLLLEQWSAAAQGFRLAARGNMNDLSGQMNIDVEGSLEYELETLTPKLRGLTFQSLELKGKQKETFALRGPLRHPVITTETATSPPTTLVPSQLAGRAALGWEAANVLGVIFGQGQVPAELQDARIQFTPLQIQVSGGQLQAAPWIDLTQAPARIVHPPGTILEHIRLSPQMCRSWLQYVAPSVANATSAEGEFSLNLERLSLPLGDAQNGDLAGTLTIDQARIGPGPLSQSIITVAQRVVALSGRQLPLSGGQRWLDLPNQQIPFQMEQGRITHRNLRMLVGDIEITSSGWVDLNRRMSLTMEIPIREEWVQNRRLLSGLAGTKLTIPVGGTLDQPQVDDQVLRQLGREAIGSAAGGLLRGLLERQMQRDEPPPEE